MVKNIAALAKAGSLDNDLRTYAGEDVCGAHVVTWYEKKCRALFVQVKMGISGWSHDKRIWEGGANPQPARSSPRRGLLQIFTGLQVCPAKGKIISVPTTTTMNTNTNMATNERGYHVPIEVRQEAGARVRAFLLDDSVEGKVVRDRGVSFEARNEELLVKLQVRHKDAPRDPREEEGPSPPVEERKRHGAEATTTKVPTMKPSAATKRPAPAPLVSSIHGDPGGRTGVEEGEVDTTRDEVTRSISNITLTLSSKPPTLLNLALSYHII